MERGTPSWSMEMLGSPEMTVLAEKSTRLPMRLPLTLPSLPCSTIPCVSYCFFEHAQSRELKALLLLMTLPGISNQRKASRQLSNAGMDSLKRYCPLCAMTSALSRAEHVVTPDQGAAPLRAARSLSGGRAVAREDETRQREHLQSLANGLDGPATPLVGHGHARSGVVEEGGHMELQQSSELPDDVLRRSILLLLLQAAVGLDDLSQLVSQVILASAWWYSRSHWSFSSSEVSCQALDTLTVQALPCGALHTCLTGEHPRGGAVPETQRYINPSGKCCIQGGDRLAKGQLCAC